MFRKVALILTVFAILCTVGSSVPGLTSCSAVACTDPSCMNSMDQSGLFTGSGSQMPSNVLCDNPGCIGG